MITEADIVVRILLAVVLGALVGIERELRGRPAGLRTHMLVCTGATLFSILALMVMESASDPSAQARVMAGILTGIGFLGGGAIIQHRDHTEGLTTAADIWVISAVGVAIGFGYYFAAALTAIVVFAVLGFGKQWLIQILKKV